MQDGTRDAKQDEAGGNDRRTQVFIFSNLHGLARYFGRVLPRETIQEEVIIATRDFRHRVASSAAQTQLEFVKLCEARLIRKARSLEISL
ncbi:MAG TPA: hypothetical protein VJ385_07000 [Fibrobacteria bacterium]|nr:hypothetical protein [Fibrobacteria bacterium]